MSEADEFSGFHTIRCADCSTPFAVHMSSWIVEVRDEVVVKFLVNPMVFLCESCGSVNTVHLTVRPEISAVLEKRGGKVQ